MLITLTFYICNKLTSYILIKVGNFCDAANFKE